MRVGLLTTSFPRHEGDPAGAFVLGFARSLVTAGHELEVLAPQPRAPGDAPRFRGVDVSFVRYCWPRSLARTFYGAGVPDNLAGDPLAWPGLASFPLALTLAARRRAARWDALVSHWALPCGLVAAELPERPPHLAVLHSADVHALEHLPGGAHLAGRVAAGSEGLLFVSQDLRRRFLELLGGAQRARAMARSRVSPMGVEAPTTQLNREQLRRDLGLSGFTALSMGRLVAIKGVEAAVRAAAETDTSLVVAGEGPERARLERLAADIRARVRFVGQVSGAHKRALLCAADAFVLPSRRLPSGRTEGTPTALLEAMAAGLPPVAAGVGGVPDVVAHGVSGLLFEPGRAQDLGVALARMRADEQLHERLSRGAREVGLAHTWESLGPRLARALDEAVDAA
ncbi:MAG: glycosyltransferase family 4 protein [Deltaproteobacteria bacterium]|nr:glycosyltransferase family 4 protein [Deltaproteobacteria bacterium]